MSLAALESTINSAFDARDGISTSTKSDSPTGAEKLVPMVSSAGAMPGGGWGSLRQPKGTTMGLSHFPLPTMRPVTGASLGFSGGFGLEGGFGPLGGFGGGLGFGLGASLNAGFGGFPSLGASLVSGYSAALTHPAPRPTSTVESSIFGRALEEGAAAPTFMPSAFTPSAFGVTRGAWTEDKGEEESATLSVDEDYKSWLADDY